MMNDVAGERGHDVRASGLYPSVSVMSDSFSSHQRRNLMQFVELSSLLGSNWWAEKLRDDGAHAVT